MQALSLINSIPCENPVKQVLLLFLFTEEETEAQQGYKK